MAIGGIDYRLRAIDGNIAGAIDGNLIDAHIRFVLDAYLPQSFELFRTLPSPIALAEDLRLVLLRYLPTTTFEVTGKLIAPDQVEVKVVATWQNQSSTVVQTIG